MSQEQRIKIPRAPDRAIIDCFTNLANKHNINTLNISATAFINIGTVDITDKNNEDFNALLSHDSTLIETCSMNISGLTVSYARGGRYQPQQKSPIYDEIILNWNEQQGKLSVKNRLEIVSIISDKLNSFQPGRVIESGLTEEQNQLLSIHEATLERLEKLNEDLVKQSSDFRYQVEKRYDNKVADLENEFSKKQTNLEQEFAKKTESLELKRNELDAKLKAIDDRDNTHVRREIRDKMLDDVKARINNFGVSKSTERKRRPVLAGILFLAIASLLLMLFTAYEINSSERIYSESLKSANTLNQAKTENASVSTKASGFEYIDRAKVYWLWIRFALFSFALFGTLLYYVKWQNKWAEQHSASEFQLQQFYIDVNRANWVIESCLEWRKETNAIVPTELLKSITRNLFTTEQNEGEQVIHPADKLASALMGSASKLKLNLNGNEIEFNKPSKISKKTITTIKDEET